DPSGPGAAGGARGGGRLSRPAALPAGARRRPVPRPPRRAAGSASGPGHGAAAARPARPAGQRHAPRPAPQLRHPSARGRGGPAVDPGTAGPRQPVDDAEVHGRRRRAPARRLCIGPSARLDCRFRTQEAALADGAVPMLNRRAMTFGMAGLAVAGPAAAQEPPLDEPRLLANLLTRMALKVRINGRRVAVFVFDIGAGRTVIAEDRAQSWERPARPPVLVHGLTAAELAPTVHVGRLSLGGRRFHDLRAPVFPRRLLAADGLMGLDVLGRFRLDLNISARRVKLTPSGPDVVAVGSAGHRATRLPSHERPARHGRFGALILRGS